jgi:hypothetical protein
LFKGCLVLESILKLLPPGSKKQTLGEAIKAHNTRLGMNLSLLSEHVGSLDKLMLWTNELLERGESFESVCFAVGFGLRNIAGHKLAWPDVFQKDDEVYLHLYKRILGAIFLSICKLWVV